MATLPNNGRYSAAFGGNRLITRRPFTSMSSAARWPRIVSAFAAASSSLIAGIVLGAEFVAKCQGQPMSLEPERLREFSKENQSRRAEFYGFDTPVHTHEYRLSVYGNEGHLVAPQPPVLTSPNLFSTLPQRFACARLSRPCLPGSCPDISAMFTTVAFD